MSARESTTLRTRAARVFYDAYQVHTRMTAYTLTADTTQADVTTITDADKVIDRTLIDRSVELTALPDADIGDQIEALAADQNPGQQHSLAIFKQGAKIGLPAIVLALDGANVTRTAATGEAQEITISAPQRGPASRGNLASPVLTTGDDLTETARYESAQVSITANLGALEQHQDFAIPAARKLRPLTLFFNIIDPGSNTNYNLAIYRRTGTGASQVNRRLTAWQPSDQTGLIQLTDLTPGDGYSIWTQTTAARNPTQLTPLKYTFSYV